MEKLFDLLNKQALEYDILPVDKRHLAPDHTYFGADFKPTPAHTAEKDEYRRALKEHLTEVPTIIYLDPEEDTDEIKDVISEARLEHIKAFNRDRSKVVDIVEY